jgi:hypothetical protein
MRLKIVGRGDGIDVIGERGGVTAIGALEAATRAADAAAVEDVDEIVNGAFFASSEGVVAVDEDDSSAFVDIELLLGMMPTVGEIEEEGDGRKAFNRASILICSLRTMERNDVIQDENSSALSQPIRSSRSGVTIHAKKWKNSFF